MDDDVLLPVVVRLRDGEVFEELAVPEEDGLHCRHAERLAEAPRPRAEEVPARRIGDQTVQMRRLVNVDLAQHPQGLEVVRLCGNRSHAAYYTINALCAERRQRSKK